MLRSLTTALGLRGRSPSFAPSPSENPAGECLPRSTLVDSTRQLPKPSATTLRDDRLPSLEAHTAREHAEALLAWLQGPGGRTGSVFAFELEHMHRELCHELIGSQRTGKPSHVSSAGCLVPGRNTRGAKAANSASTEFPRQQPRVERSQPKL